MNTSNAIWSILVYFVTSQAAILIIEVVWLKWCTDINSTQGMKISAIAWPWFALQTLIASDWLLLVCRENCSIYGLHAGRTRKWTHEPVVNTLLVVDMDAWQVAQSIADLELTHADHTSEHNSPSVCHKKSAVSPQYMSIQGWLVTSHKGDKSEVCQVPVCHSHGPP